MSEKRKGYLTWDAYFMGIALLSAQRSKDSSTQVGSCIVNQDNKILSMGYNGMPTGCDDDEMPWSREGDTLNSKYAFVCHAELNAILNYSGGSLKGTRIYSTLFPCNECSQGHHPKQGSGRSSTCRTNMPTPTASGPASGCSTWLESSTGSMSLRDRRSPCNCNGKEEPL